MVDPLQENTAALRSVSLDYPTASYWIGAIGDNTGETCIYVHGDQSSLLKGAEWPGELRQVPIRTLDSFLKDGSVKKSRYPKDRCAGGGT